MDLVRTQPKPTRTTKDGRVLLSPAGLRALTDRLYLEQHGLCFHCDRWVARFNFIGHHGGRGRGAGGHLRNDRAWFDFPEAIAAAMKKEMLTGYVYGMNLYHHNEHHEEKRTGKVAEKA